MTNTEIKIRLEKILVRNEQRKVNKLIPADILDIKDIIKQLTLTDVGKSFYCWDEQALGKERKCQEECDVCASVRKEK